MVNVQVKRVPDDMHSALKERARERGISLNDLLLEMLKRELGRPSVQQWVADVRSHAVRADVDIEKLMDDVRNGKDAR